MSQGLYGWCAALLWSSYKFIYHLVSGRSEIHRICEMVIPDQEFANRLFKSIRYSKTLTVTKDKLWGDDAVDIASAVQNVASTKAIPSAVQPTLQRGISLLAQVNDAVRVARTHYQTPYSGKDADHEAMLEKLWTLLRPDTPRRNGRFTEEWGEIGFQGKDPATDFRGMGLFGLMQLLYFAERYPRTARDCLLVAHSQYSFSYAIVGINISGLLVDLVRQRSPAAIIPFLAPAQTDALALERWHELYSRTFVNFTNAWVAAKPENIMKFGEVFAAFKADFLENKLDMLPLVVDAGLHANGGDANGYDKKNQ